ncbi:FecCD family ABC transporter permease [Nonomuraea typhae]|uniref:FecCD family ABC transporter permease n=1 Tax=Nonomuraea typhae TaxID=2603600 RepID=UPI0012F725D7|nr:iron chelate uptake ABC transporter family permease subunit [Nonomuraea typhae]
MIPRKPNTGRREWTVRTPLLSARLDRRAFLVNGALAAVIVVTALAALGLGDIFVPLPDVFATFHGGGSRMDTIVVQQWRLTRVLLALVLGFGLAVSGAVFQSLTRNPLGSPDVIGFTTGSYTGAIVLIAVFHAPTAVVSAGALASGLVVAAIVLALSYRGGLRGFRLIVVGIGVSAILSALNTWIMAKTELQVAMTAALWGNGSLNSVAPDALPVAIAGTAVFSAAAVLYGSRVRALEMGLEAAAALGVRVRRTQVVLTATGVGLVAVATAVAGPISFIALVAPQIAARLTGRGGWAPVGAGLVGALLLLFGDTVARAAFLPVQLPVGVVTVCLGGLYLIWLLVREARRL